jgi:uncharacterized membrane protein
MATSAVEASIIVEARLPAVYQQWLRVEEYPQFLRAIRSVRKLDPNHFSVQGSLEGQQFKVALEIMLRVPERRVAWRLLHDHLTAGVVCFGALSGDRTQITLKMMSSFGGLLSQQVESFLQEFKHHIESS